jgi:hypothetical protein
MTFADFFLIRWEKGAGLLPSVILPQGALSALEILPAVSIPPEPALGCLRAKPFSEQFYPPSSLQSPPNNAEIEPINQGRE